MGWLSLYNEQGAFTWQIRDKDKVGMKFQVDGDLGRGTESVRNTRLLTIPGGEQNECNLEVGFHEGDWHRSAEIYGRWAHSWMDFSYVNTNWAKFADGWLAGSHFYSSYLASRYMTHLIPEMEWLGASYAQHFANHIDGSFSESTFFLINPRYGSFEDYKKAHAESARHGIYHTYYTPSRGFSDVHATNDRIGATPRTLVPPEIKMPPAGFGARWGARQNGELLAWGWTGQTPSVMICPASKGGHDWLLEGFTRNYCELAGAPGVYSDEACGFVECTDQTHGHGKQYGLWEKGLQESYKEALDIARKRDANVALAIEGCPDQLLQYADFGLCYGGVADALLYALPEVKFIGTTLAVGSPEETVHSAHLLFRIWGSNNEAQLNLRQFFAHRKRIKDWMYNGKFRDDVGLTISRPGIIAKYFERGDSDHDGVLINIENEFAFDSATMTLVNDKVKSANFAIAYLLDEEEVVKVQSEKVPGGLKFTIPKAKASSILIPSRFPVQEALRVHLVWPQAPGPNKLVLYIVNMSDVARNIGISFKLPAGVSVREPASPQVVNARDVLRLELPIEGNEHLAKQEYASVFVKDSEFSQETRTLLTPPISNGGFEIDSVGKGTPDGWRAFDHTWFTHLIQQSELPFDLSHADGIIDSVEPAAGKFSLRLNVSVPLR
ncbi:MAG: DUF6259 domain-containing protein, partial [Phycisphaerae bacterium]